MKNLKFNTLLNTNNYLKKKNIKLYNIMNDKNYFDEDKYGETFMNWEDNYMMIPFKNYQEFKKEIISKYFEKHPKLNIPIWIRKIERYESPDIEIGVFQPSKGRAIIYIIENITDEEIEKITNKMEKMWKNRIKNNFKR
ncbi:MAG: hypothetical protein ACOCP8_06935 [archaeon]